MMMTNGSGAMNDVNFTSSPASVPEAVLSDNLAFACGIYITIIGTMATVGNGGIIILFLNAKHLFKQTQNWLVFNLALADVGISIFGFPFVGISCYANRWIFGKTVCEMYAFQTFWFSMVSYYTLTALGVFRFIHICKPLYKRYLTKKNTCVVILVAWVYGLLWPVMPFLGWGHYDYEKFGTSCTLAWTQQTPNDISMNIASTIICFLAPLVIMVYCYYKVLHHTQFVRVRGAPGQGLNGMRTMAKKSETKLALMCSAMVAGFVITWGPYAVISIVSTFYRVSLATSLIPTMCAKLAPCMNFFLYSVANENFRKLFFRKCCRCMHTIKPARMDPYSVARYVNTYSDPNMFFSTTALEEIHRNQPLAILPAPQHGPEWRSASISQLFFSLTNNDGATSSTRGAGAENVEREQTLC